MQYVLCMGAFWYERVAAMDSIIYLPYMFLSGLVFPFEVLPDTVRTVLLWTPFPYMVWFPAALLVNEEVPIARGFAIMIAWTVVFFALYRWLWKKGLKHYSAMGA
jgi:ABC-2 type transport system permease protein